MAIRNFQRIAQYNMEHITDVALDLFFKKGIKATSVEEIAKCGKISRVTIYKYFPNKLDIVRSVHSRYLQVWSPCARETFFSEIYPTLSGFEQIYRQLSIYIEMHLENPAFLPFLCESNIMLCENNTARSASKLSDSMDKEFNKFYFNAIRKGFRDGSICKRVEFEEVDYLCVRKIIEGAFLKCYLSFGREYFFTHSKEVYHELKLIVDNVYIAFFKPLSSL